MQQAASQGQGSASGKRGGAGRFFIRGLGVILPSVLTLWILVTAFRFVDSNIAGPINAGIRLGVSAVADSGALPQFAPGDDQIADEVARAQRLRLDDSRGAASWRVTRANVDAWWKVVKFTGWYKACAKCAGKPWPPAWHPENPDLCQPRQHPIITWG